MDGFQIPERGQDNQSAEISVDQLEAEKKMRWLLRRFVDPEWIDVRLESKADDQKPEISDDLE